MALPTLAKSWQFNLNHRVVAAGNSDLCKKAVMFYTKNTLIGFASNPWTVIGSSNSVASGMDAVDRWITASNLVWNTAGVSAHSWIVLQQTGLNAKFQICIDLGVNNTNPDAAFVVMSPTAGFGTVNGGTNGSTTTRPTATDEIAILDGSFTSSGLWLDGTTGGIVVNEDYIVNAWQSTDGQVTRVLFRRPQLGSNQFCGFFSFEKPKNPIAQWLNPVMARWKASTNGVMLYTTFNDIADYIGNKPGGGSMAFLATTEHYLNAAVGERITTINDLTGGYQLTPMGLLSLTTGTRGRHGEVFDFWYGVTTLQDGDTYPTGGSKQFIQLGNLVLPWDGSSPIMT